MKRFLIPLVLLLIILPAAVSAGQHGFMDEIVAYASGKQEVPGVATDATAVITLSFRLDFRNVNYTLTINDDPGDIVAAHLHCGLAGSNGPVVVGLSLSGAGVLRNANIIETECDDVTINNIASLFAAIKEDQIYLNVHSLTNLGGEVRAQIFLPFFLP